MKKISFALVLISLLTLSACSQSTVSQDSIQDDNTTGQNHGRNGQNQAELEYDIDEHDFVQHNALIADIELSELSDEEREGLILMREEEKLARDVYLALGEEWGQQIFTNIAGSEQTHTDSIKTLLDRYEIEDPVTDDTIGVFQSETLQGLYNDLVEQGSKSLTDALIVGATIEDLDINDLNNLLDATDNEDIILVYENLAKGSRNHLRAFLRNLERNGGEYAAQYISDEEYQTILDTDQERGQANKGSRDNFRGQGRNSSQR